MRAQQEPATQAKSPFAHRVGRASHPEAAPPPKRGKKSSGPIVIIVALLVLVAGAGAFFLSGGKEKQTARPPIAATPPSAQKTSSAPTPSKPVVAEKQTALEQAPKALENKPAPKTPEAGEVFFTAKLGLAFSYAPPGSFVEGSPEGESGRSPDEVRRKVTLTRGFRLGVTCVTQAQWDAVMGRGTSASKLAEEKRVFTGADLPMINVTWAEAETFCRRLSATENGRFRLPTEAEWEYACRAGSNSPYGGEKTFLATSDAIFDDGSAHPPEGPRAVSAPNAPVNSWGLRDMHGNIWQWCADRYASRSDAPATDPIETAGTDESTGRVVRGGSWNDPARSARSAKRWQYPPAVAVNYIGFRVLMEYDATGRLH